MFCLFFAGLFFAAACEPGSAHPDFKYKIIEEGGASGYHYGDEKFQGGIFVFHDQASWKQFWGAHRARLSQVKEDLPSIDFSNQTVLVFLGGFQPRGGSAVEIQKVNAKGSNADVYWHLRAPSGISATIISNPFLIVSLQGSAWSVRSFRR